MQKVSATGVTNKRFTGTLVRRQYKRGQPYVQLVVEGPRGLQLSLSRNRDMIRSLKVGELYQVEGPEHQIGDKSYIYEPHMVAVANGKGMHRFSKRWIAISAAAFALLLTGTVLIARHFATSSKAQAQAIVTTQQADVQGDSTVLLSGDGVQPSDAAATDPAVNNAPQTPASSNTPVTRKVAQNTTPTPSPASPTPATPDPTPEQTPPADDPAPADTTPPAETPPADIPSDDQTPPDATPPPEETPGQ